VEPDTKLLLSLLAVRLLGGQSVPAASAELKGFKDSIKQAKERGLLKEEKVKLPTVKAGKTKMTATAVLGFTEEGESYLHQSCSNEVLASTTSGHLMALRQNLEADRKALREEVVATLSAKAKGKGDGSLSKELQALSKTVSDLAAKLHKLESAVQGGPDDKILAKIDQAFDALTVRLDRALAKPTAHHSETAAKETSAPSAGILPGTLAKMLRKAYDELCHFIEFKDGLVEIPRLYYEAKRSVPNLTVEALHKELDALWQARELELQICNDPRAASEPAKGINRDNKLYYYVYWRKP
jgi:hypothetical protein